MNAKIFRRSSLDRVNSPEQLDDYIKVANPSVWMMLVAIVGILLAELIWGCFGIVETKVTVLAKVDDSGVICYVSEDGVELLEEGVAFTMNAYSGEIIGSVIEIAEDPVKAGEEMNDYQLYQMDLDADDECYEVKMKMDGLPNGEYVDMIVLDRIHPISFVTQ